MKYYFSKGKDNDFPVALIIENTEELRVLLHIVCSTNTFPKLTNNRKLFGVSKPSVDMFYITFEKILENLAHLSIGLLDEGKIG